MNKRMNWMMAAVLAAGMATAVEVDVTADFASAYIFRGVTLNKGMVFQPGVEVSSLPIPEAIGSLTVGIWANMDISDHGGELDRWRFSEVDYYISYGLPVSGVDLDITYTEYTYPNGGGSADREIAFGIGKEIGETGLAASMAANYGLSGAVKRDLYIEAGLDYELELTDALTMSAGVTAGYLISHGGKDGFHDASVGVGLSYALTERLSLNGSLVYVAQLDSSVLSSDDYDRPGYAMIGLAYSF